jgi:hypothetical protein
VVDLQAFYCRTGLRAPVRAPVPARRPAQTSLSAPPRRLLARNAPSAAGWRSCPAGVIRDIFPGVLPFVALAQIANLDASNAAKIAAIVAFYLIMSAFIEVPILAYAVAPARTTTAISRCNA